MNFIYLTVDNLLFIKDLYAHYFLSFYLFCFKYFSVGLVVYFFEQLVVIVEAELVVLAIFLEYTRLGSHDIIIYLWFLNFIQIFTILHRFFISVFFHCFPLFLFFWYWRFSLIITFTCGSHIEIKSAFLLQWKFKNYKLNSIIL